MGTTSPSSGKFTQIDTNDIWITGKAYIEEGAITLGKAGAAGQGQIVLHDNQSGDDYTTTLKSADDVDANLTLTLPASNGSANQVLSTDGSGRLGWLNVFSPATQVFASNGLTGGGELSGDRTLAVLNDGSTLSASASGVKVADGGITATQLNSSVAGNGLTGGGGTPLAVGSGTNDGISVSADAVEVNVDNTTIEINSDKLRVKDNGISSAKIQDGAIVEADLNSGSVTSAKILDGTITEADFGGNSVTFAKIQDGTIQQADLSFSLPKGHSLDADDGDPVNAVYVDSNGNMGIGTTSPTEVLDVTGSIQFDGSLIGPAPTEGPSQLDAALITPTHYYDRSPNEWVWQSFTAETTGFLTQIDIKHINNPIDNGILRIYSGEGTGGNLLLDQNIVGTTDWSSYALDSPIAVTAGHKYTFSVQRREIDNNFLFGVWMPREEGFRNNNHKI
ncbi:MAG: hypothetical protein JXA79_13460 [Deltaproteobacteria bacterium]|nr:hypothetical protein [Deltaproteobacteria bacterium]